MCKKITRIFKENGLKTTPQRIEIYKTLINADNHPSAEDIYSAVKKRFPNISFDTVYRTLSLFVKYRIIKKVSFMPNKMLYDKNTSHHHHFVCIKCHKIVDFTWEEIDKIPLPKNIQSLGNIEDRYIEIRGICKECLEK